MAKKLNRKDAEAQRRQAESLAEAQPQEVAATEADEETQSAAEPPVPTYTLQADDSLQRVVLFLLVRMVRQLGPTDAIPELERVAREFELYTGPMR